MRHFAVALATMCCLIQGSCKKTETDPTHNTTPGTQPGMFFITDIVGDSKAIGFIVNDPIDKKQFAAFGSKNEEGEMDSIKYIMENFVENDGWLSHQLDENFMPVETTTSTGHTIEYYDINKPAKKAGVRVKETQSGKVLWEKPDLNLPDNFYDIADEIDKYRKNNKYKNHPSKADLLYLGSNLAGCFIGVAGFSMGGPVAMAWSAYNTYQSCKSAGGALANMLEGNPAFGCMSVEDHVNAFSGFGEAYVLGGNLTGMAKGSLPGLIGYAFQTAGQENCDRNGDEPPPLPQLPPRDAGVSWGDPHLITADGFPYDFHGVGEFIAAKALNDNFEVQVRLGNPYISNPQTTFNLAIAVNTGADVVSYSASGKMLWVNNVQHTAPFTQVNLAGNAFVKKEMTAKFDRITIQHSSGDQVVIIDAGLPYLDYHLRLTDSRKNKMEGLMGNYDGNPENDLSIRNGAAVTKRWEDLYPKYADSWRIEQAKSLFFYEPGKNTESYTRKDLPKKPVAFDFEKYEWAEQICKAAGVNEEPFLTGCMVDVYTSGNAEVAKSAVLAEYEISKKEFEPLNMTNILLQSDAAFTDNSIRLTRNKSYLAGQAYNKLAVNGDFETSFVFRLGLSANGGADGLALVIAKQIPEPINNDYPGRAGKLGYNGVPACVAIEFDSSLDFYNEDESPNHAAIHTNGKGINTPHKSHRIAFNKDIIPLEDGMYHTAKVRYKNKQITVWLDGAPVLEKDIDLKNELGLTNGCFLGLTASTSSSSQAHYIHNWEIKNL